jgi:hypothetical protein
VEHNPRIIELARVADGGTSQQRRALRLDGIDAGAGATLRRKASTQGVSVMEDATETSRAGSLTLIADTDALNRLARELLANGGSSIGAAIRGVLEAYDPRGPFPRFRGW